MNNEQFSLGIKITIVCTCLVLLAVGILTIYVLRIKDNNTSILDVSGTTIKEQLENDDEFKQYLEVFALAVQEERVILEKHLETVIGFLNQIMWYETVPTDEEYVCYDKNTVENVAKELLGITILETGEDIVLDEKYNAYRYVYGKEFLSAKCMDIISVSRKDDIYNVEYTCTFPGESELYELAEENNIVLNTYKIRATIQQNEKYEYSKYYLKNIELVSKDIVQYN